MVQKECILNKQIIRTVSLKYLTFLPEDYESVPDKKWPLILFLHGIGERGDCLDYVPTQGLPKMLKNMKSFPFITICPQCPENAIWPLEMDVFFPYYLPHHKRSTFSLRAIAPEDINVLLDEVIDKYHVDAQRIYLTGLSMGGFATWYLAAAYPDRFAAIAPICGGGLPEKASKIKSIPAWVFHGGKDSVIPINESEDMVKALKEHGANVRFTVYPEAGHDSWTETYNNPELYKWFLQHRKQG